MPRRALRCIVDLQVNVVSAPGVWLPSKEDVYVSISLFNQYRNTRLITSIFPLLVHEKFRFEKTYYTALDPSHVTDMLEDELVIFELVQLSEYTDGAVRLASYSTNARDFLYPYPTLAPSYSAHDREVLLCRTIAFPGISPKLEFSTKTIIRESVSAELDALDDALDMERESRSLRKSRRRARFMDCEKEFEDVSEGNFRPRGRSRTRRRGSAADVSGASDCPPHHQMPTVSSLSRSRSASPTARRRLADIDLEDTIDPRPPFVVRKLESSLIGRTPSATSDKVARSKPKRSLSPVRSPSRSALDDKSFSRALTPTYRVSKVIRDPLDDPKPVYKSRYLDDLDTEVADLTSKTSYVSPRLRPRSVSPILYRSSFRDRYGTYVPLYTPRYSVYWPYTSSYYETLAETERELERARVRRLGRLYGTYYSSLDDLELELRLARIRAGRY